MAESLKNVYAEAVFELCNEQGITEQAAEELEGVGEVFSQNDDFAKLLASPLISKDEKDGLLKNTFGGKVCDTVFDFICLTVDKGRARYIAQICEEFKKLWYQKQGILEVSVVIAMPISKELEDKLRIKLESMLGKKIIMKLSVDKSLIGGIVIRYEGAELDSSVKGRLDRLRSQIDSIIA